VHTYQTCKKCGLEISMLYVHLQLLYTGARYSEVTVSTNVSMVLN